jgi:mannose-6-phosphate isomerase-like protein (cupin superfamily)
MGIAPFSPVRRVVTGHDATGKAIAIIDDNTPYKATRPDSGTMQQRIWVTDKGPADMRGDKDRGGIEVRIAPPANGSIIRVLDIPPENAAAAKLPNDHMAKLLGDQHHAPNGVRPPRHPGMHRTRTIDYAIILAGEIDMLLDDTEVHLKAGDILVQQATNHAWVNRGKEPCRICFVLIDGADPLV